MLVRSLVLAVTLCLVAGQDPRIINVVVPESGRVTFESPNYPAAYPYNLHIHYVITGPKGLALEFDVEKLDLEMHTDALYLTEVIAGRGSIAFGTVAGKDGLLPSKFQSATDEVVGIFKSDSTSSGMDKGFKIGVQSTRALADLTDTLEVNCTRGKLSWSEADFMDTDKSQVHFSVDRTIKCRSMMYDAHTFILGPEGKKPERSLSRVSIARPISVTCNSTGLVVSENDPDNSEAEDLTFMTTANLKCRQIFVDFLNHLSKL